MWLMGRGAACGIQIYKPGEISTDGKQVAESSGTVQCEILQLYVFIACQSQTCSFPCRQNAQKAELSAVQGAQQRRFSYWSVFAAVLGGERAASAPGDQGLKSLQ